MIGFSFPIRGKNNPIKESTGKNNIFSSKKKFDFAI